MRTTSYDLRHLPDDALLADLGAILRRNHVVEAELLVHLAELDARKLYLERAYSSLFTFCTGMLHMSEGEAYRRMHAARAGQRFPLVFDMVGDGRLHLSAVSLLAPHLTEDNHRELLEAAVHRSKREVEKLLAVRFPKPDVGDSIRKAPTRGGAQVATPAPVSEPAPVAAAASAPTMAPSTAADCPAPAAVPAVNPQASQASFTLDAPAPRSRIEPLSEDRYLIKTTVSQAVHDKLLRAQALLRHTVPGGELEQVLDRALDALLDSLARDKFGQTERPRAKAKGPRPGSRHVRAQTRRAVIARDGERCSFVDPETGRRCNEPGFVQFDHKTPYARGGGDSEDEIRVLCGAHNRHAAEKEFGERFVKERIERARAGDGSRAGARGPKASGPERG